MLFKIDAKLSSKLPGINVVFLAHIEKHLLLFLLALVLQHLHGLSGLRIGVYHLRDSCLHHLHHGIIHVHEWLIYRMIHVPVSRA